jgi:hypothetical protein
VKIGKKFWLITLDLLTIAIHETAFMIQLAVGLTLGNQLRNSRKEEQAESGFSALSYESRIRIPITLT